MKAAIFVDGNKFTETEFELEENFEKIIKDNSKVLFGTKTVYLDIKSKVEAKSLGAAIPDGVLFDLKDKDNPEFYLVEVELAKHDFYKHMFPQVTKFFAFYKNASSRNNLIETLFRLIKSNPKLEEEFKEYLEKKEIYKWIKDTIENSQNILLVIDENKPEFQEIFETYTDTWGKLVKVGILKVFTANKKIIFSLNPDFETIGLAEAVSISEEAQTYTEQYHLEDVDKNMISIYEKIKEYINKLDANIKVNPQHYYISLRKNRNFAFIKIKKKKLHIVLMIPYVASKKIIKKNKITKLSQGIQNFYNGPCFKVTLENNKNINEVFTALKEAYNRQNK